LFMNHMALTAPMLLCVCGGGVNPGTEACMAGSFLTYPVNTETSASFLFLVFLQSEEDKEVERHDYFFVSFVESLFFISSFNL
jgi:hypothetical protein